MQLPNGIRDGIAAKCGSKRQILFGRYVHTKSTHTVLEWADVTASDAPDDQTQL